MSRSQSYTSKYQLDPELIERRQLRGGRLGIPEQLSNTEEHTVIISERTKKEIRQLLDESKSSIQYVRMVKGWEGDIFDSMLNGSFGEKYSWFNEEQNGHEIYSPYTEKKVTEVLEYNPALTPEYLKQGKDDEILLLKHSPIQKRVLNKQELVRITTKLWGFLHWMTPPQEFIESAIFTRNYLGGINKRIDETRTFLNIALARPKDEEK